MFNRGVGRLPRRQSSLDNFLLIAYLIFGVYFLNFFPLKFNFLNLPQSLLMTSNWIIFVAGILLIFSVITSFKLSRLKRLTLGY